MIRQNDNMEDDNFGTVRYIYRWTIGTLALCIRFRYIIHAYASTILPDGDNTNRVGSGTIRLFSTGSYLSYIQYEECKRIVWREVLDLWGGEYGVLDLLEDFISGPINRVIYLPRMIVMCRGTTFCDRIDVKRTQFRCTKWSKNRPKTVYGNALKSCTCFSTL